MSRQIRRSVRNARRPAARRSTGGSSNWVWYLAMAAVAAIVIGGFVLAEQMRRRNAFDPVTLCPEDGPSGVIAILLDLTDPVTPAQATRLRTMLGRDIAQAPAGTFISVGLVSQDPAAWGARFTRCKPLSQAEANPLIQNPRLLGETYNDDFIVPLSAALDDMTNRGTEDTSPIMESLQALVAGTPALETVDGPRRLVIVSDLLQNSDQLSFYRGEFWDAFETMDGPRRLAGDLAGVDVTLIRISRPAATAPDPAEVDAFWLHYFDLQGTNGGFDVRPLGEF